MGQKRTRPKQQRLDMAKLWLPTYSGKKIVKGYRKKFAVDNLTAIRDLQELGIQFKPEYISAVEASEKQKVLQRQQEKQAKLAEQHYLEMIYEESGIWDGIYGKYNDEIDIMSNHRVNFENRIGTVKKAGKNHVKVNGTLLQTNKKWSHLKQKQKDWIYELASTEHEKFIEENSHLPIKNGKKKLIAAIEAKIDERGIWLPSHELAAGIGKYIDRLNRKADLEDLGNS